MIWFFSLLSLAALLQCCCCGSARAGPHGHGLEIARVSPARAPGRPDENRCLETFAGNSCASCG